MSPFNRILSANQRCAPSRLSLTLHGVSSLRDCDESTKPQAAAVFTLLLSEFGEFDRKAAECVFIWEEARRDWLCLLSDCCLCVSSTTNRDSLLFIWTPAQTSDLSKWVANPSPSYCGARVGVPAMLPPSGPKGELHRVYTAAFMDKIVWSIFQLSCTNSDKLYSWIVVKCEKKKGLCTTWSEVSG